MMQKLIFNLILLSFMTSAIAQTEVSSPAGEYYLRGVMETASGFKLNPDKSFEFFFSYGALDRMGKGNWSVEGDSLVLSSGGKPPDGFGLVGSKKTGDTMITIRISEENEIFLKSVYCIISGGGKTQESISDAKGMISFQPQEIDSIQLLFEFCPEKRSVFTIKGSADNSFEFRFEASMMDVFFNKFRLKSEPTQLSGPHPLMKGESFIYKKAGR